VYFLLFLGIEQRASPATGFLRSAHQAHRLPAVEPGRHTPAVHLIDVGKVRQRVSLVAEPKTMRSHPSTPRRMIAMHVVQGVDFSIAKRGNILHRECSRSGLRFVSIESCSLWYRGYQMSLNSLRKIVSGYLVSGWPGSF
jgi:hypothetical protein